MSNMSQEEMTEAVKYRKDLPLWRRAILWYIGGSWISSIAFFFVGALIGMPLANGGAENAGGVVLFALGLPFFVKIFRLITPFLR